jgi:aryl-alcohol dehydrogenase-like predicted oxidoreductase
MKDRVMLPRRAVLAAGAGVTLVPAWGRVAQAQLAASSMLTRPIPVSGEALPVIGLGTATVFEIGGKPEERASRAAVIRKLVAAGGSVIDTAPSYGTADSVVGDLVAEAGLRDKVFLATKLEDFDKHAAQNEFQGSLRRLRTARVDLVQLHNVSNPRQDLAMLRDWKAQGLCRYTGITTTSHRDFAAAEAILRREKPDFLEIDYSLEDREAEKRLIPAALELGTAVLIAQPFGGGNIFGSIRQRPLPEWAKEFGAATWGQFFIKFLLGNPAVTAVIPGTGNPAHMDDNLGAGHGRIPDAAERKKMVEFFTSAG